MTHSFFLKVIVQVFDTDCAVPSAARQNSAQNSAAELALDSPGAFGYNVNHGEKPRAGVMEWQT